ncbi:MAG: S41 family peptidase [Pseudomonadota bacterium]
MTASDTASVTVFQAASSSTARFLMLSLVAAVMAIGHSSSWSSESVDDPSSPNSSEALGYRDDLLELADRIKTLHPRPFRFISESGFDQLVATRVAAMAHETTKAEFLWAFSELLSSIQCGHSRLPYFNQEDALTRPADRFPVEVRFVGERLYVLDPLVNEGPLRVGDEISSINGRAVSALREEVFRHISGEGMSETSKVHAFNTYATAYLTYALGFPDAYRLTRVGDEEPLALRPLTAYTPKPIFHPRDPCQGPLCYRVDPDSNAGIMTIRSFAYYGDQGKVFADFVDNALEDITGQGRSALLVDLRAHQGGSGNASAYLLRRLASAPFAYFGPPTDERASADLQVLQQPVDVGVNVPRYLVVDGNTVSSAPHFAALFKEHGMGTVIGEAMGGNHSTNDGARPQRSSAHGVAYAVARMRFDVVAPRQPMDQPVRPDHKLAYSVEDVLEGTDSMMEAVLSRIEAHEDPAQGR